MIENFLEHLEDDAIRQVRTAISKAKYQRFLNIAHYLFQITIAVLSFFIVLISFSLSSRYTSYRVLVICSGIAFSFLLIFSSQFLKRNPRFMNFLTSFYIKLRANRERKKYADFFYNERIWIVLILYLPLFLFFIAILFIRTDWIRSGSELHTSKLDTMKHIINFSLTVITIQTALFAFLLGQLLGKYSSKIAMALIKHPVLFLTLLYPLISLVLLWASIIYGFPIMIESVIEPWLLSSIIFCLIFTMFITLKGIHPDRVVTYVGTSFSGKIKKSFKPSTFKEGQQSYFWNFMKSIGLDLRSLDRLSINEAPPSSVRLLNEQLTSLFNTANKAIQESHEELLKESLRSILRIMQTYTKIRASYYGSSDPVYDYARNQMSALLKASSKSLNEYIIRDVVQAIGTITFLSLEIKRSPDVQYRTDTSHDLSLLWCALLVEAFDLSHTLLNCTAANEVISQLQCIAIQAFNKQQYGVIPYSFFQNLRKIYRTCIANIDSYHRVLACKCIRSIMKVWAYANLNPLTRDNLGEYYFQQFPDVIQEMANTYHELPPSLAIDFNNPPNILASKLSRQQCIIQDIFYLTLSRNFSEDWHMRIAINDLKKIIQLLKILAVHSLQHRVISCDNYIMALYEISYLVFRGLPDHYCQPKEVDPEDTFRIPPTPNQQVLEEDILAVWPALFSLFYKGDPPTSLQWPQAFFAILGLGICAFKERKDENLKSQLLLCIISFRDLVLADHQEDPQKYRDHWWKYLQLVGAWTHLLLEEKDLGNDIAQCVGNNKPFSSGFHGTNTDGRYGHLGYPTIHHTDFFIPSMNNLREQQYLTDADWDKLRECQGALMNDEILTSYYKIVEKIRKPLRDQFYESIRKAQEKRDK